MGVVRRVGADAPSRAAPVAQRRSHRSHRADSATGPRTSVDSTGVSRDGRAPAAPRTSRGGRRRPRRRRSAGLRHQATIASTASGAPSAWTATEPSGSLRTQPDDPELRGLLLGVPPEGDALHPAGHRHVHAHLVHGSHDASPRERRPTMAAPAPEPRSSRAPCQAAPRRARRGGPDDRRRRAWLVGAPPGTTCPSGRSPRPPASSCSPPARSCTWARGPTPSGRRRRRWWPPPAACYDLADGVLYRWRDGAADSARVADLGGIGWLSTTADGRYLAYVDHEHGPRNLGDHRIAETVVFDTTTGREVVRDAAGNGARTGTEDLADLYGESTPTVLGFDDDAVYSQTARGGAVLRWDLATGRRSALGPRERPVTENRPAGRSSTSTSSTGSRGSGRARGSARTPAAAPGRQPPRVHAGARPARVLLGGPPADAAGRRRAAVRAGGLRWTTTGSTASPSTGRPVPPRR